MNQLSGVRIVPVLKSSGEVRICVDLTQLSKSVLQERFASPKVDVLSIWAGASYFRSWILILTSIKLNWQMCVSSSPLYHVFRLLLFLSATIWNKFYPGILSEAHDAILDGLPGIVNFMDEISVFGTSKSEVDEQLHAVLRKLSAAGSIRQNFRLVSEK